jgi:hypothetical protein
MAIEFLDAKDSDVWEAIQVLNGDVFIYHGGYKEEVLPRDVFRFNAGMNQSGQITYQFSRFDFNPATPSRTSSIRLNRAAIVFAWYVDPGSDFIQRLKKAIPEMDAKMAGLVLP